MRLDELTRKELAADTDTVTRNRSKLIPYFKYAGITEDYTVLVHVRSVTANPPREYLVKIKLLEYPDIANDEDLTVQEKVRLAITGDVAISCSCPAFLYWGFDYIVSQLDSKAGPEQTIFPKVRNPKLLGCMCKHCYKAVNGFGTSWNRIASDIQNGRFVRE